jgi:hypothetical protein
MDSHIKAVGIIQILYGALLLVVGLFLFGIIAGSGAASGEREAMFVTGIVGTVLGGFMACLSLPHILAGIGVLKQRNWARILTIILACLSLLQVPFGTAVGAYSLWVLLNDQARPAFA